MALLISPFDSASEVSGSASGNFYPISQQENNAGEADADQLPRDTDSQNDDAPSKVLRVIIADDVAEWRSHTARVLLEVVGDTRVEIFEAADATEVILRMAGIERDTRGAVDLVLCDLHMSDGKNSGKNGDAVLANLMEGEGPHPRFAFVSGTLTEKAKVELAERIPGIHFLEKDAFLPMMDASETRVVLRKNIAALLARSGTNIPRDPEYLALLRQMQDRLAEVVRMDVFTDQVKAKVGALWNRFAGFLSAIPSAEILCDLRLYDDDHSGVKLHEFKNNLSRLIDGLQSQGNFPPGLLEALILLQAYINRTWSKLVEDRPTADVVEAIRGIVASCNTFQPGRIALELERESLDIPIDLASHNAVIAELLQNALVHGKGNVTVRISPGGRVRIENQCTGHLDFSIDDNEVSGDLPEHSTSPRGSGQGLRLLLEQAKRLGIRIHLFSSDDTVCIDLQYPEQEVEELDPENQGRELREFVEQYQLSPDAQKLDTVVFLCHDGTPEETFQDLLKREIPGVRFECLSTRNLTLESIREYREKLQHACLCVAHVDRDDMDPIFSALHEVCPHMVILPATGNRAFLCNAFAQAEIDGLPRDDYHAGRRAVLTQELLESRMGTVEHPVLYTRDYGASAFAFVVHIAREIAAERKTAKGEGKGSAPQESDETFNATERRTIVLLCHERTPEVTWGCQVENADKGEFDYVFLPMPWIPVGMEDDSATERIVQDWLAQNRETFEKSFCCAIHVAPAEFSRILVPLSQTYSHLVLLPSSADKDLLPRVMKRYRERGKEIWAKHVLTMGEINEDPESHGKFFQGQIDHALYSKSYPREIWDILMRIAQRVYSARSAQAKK